MVGGLASTQAAGRSGTTGSSKDVWVLKANPEEADLERAEVLALASVQARPAVVPRALDDLYWFGRYTARAEDTLRLLLAAHTLTEDFQSRPYSAGGQASTVMVNALSALTGPAAEADEVDRQLRAILLDANQAGIGGPVGRRPARLRPERPRPALARRLEGLRRLRPGLVGARPARSTATRSPRAPGGC